MRGGVGFFGALAGAVAIVGASLVVAPSAGAVDGSLDIVLGGDGLISVTALDHAWAMAAAPGSKIVVVGKSGTQPAVVRLLENGTPDDTFDGDGIMLLPPPSVGANGSANAVAVATDGTIAVAGSFGFDGEFTARVSETGALIETFGGTGIVYSEYAGMGASRDVAVTSTGMVYRLFVCCGAPPYSAVYRYSATGTELTLWETDEVPTGNQGFDPYQLLLQANGSVTMVGSSWHPASEKSRLAVWRRTSTGVNDSSFSSDGWAFVGTGDWGSGAYLGDKLVLAGTYDESAVKRITVAKLTAAGVLDTTFGGGDGIDDRTAPVGMDRVSDVVTRVDGRFYLVGGTQSSTTDLMVQRRLKTGGPDLAFSGDGLATVATGVAMGVLAGSSGPAGDVLVLGGGSSARELARIDGTDATAPTGAAFTAPTSRFVLSKTLKPQWTATDPSGISGYDVSRLGAAYNAALPTTWTPFYTGAATTSSLATDYGKTQCFRVRAKDAWGTFSAYSARKCAAVPLTISSLSYSAGWTAKASSAAYGGAVRTTKTNAAAASRTGVKAERVALVVTKCKTCGSVKVKYTGTLGGRPYNVTTPTISLVAGSTLTKQIVQLTPLTGVFTGTVSIRVASATGKTVTIEGLGLYKD